MLILNILDPSIWLIVRASAVSSDLPFSLFTKRQIQAVILKSFFPLLYFLGSMKLLIPRVTSVVAITAVACHISALASLLAIA